MSALIIAVAVFSMTVSGVLALAYCVLWFMEERDSTGNEADWLSSEGGEAAFDEFSTHVSVEDFSQALGKTLLGSRAALAEESAESATPIAYSGSAAGASNSASVHDEVDDQPAGSAAADSFDDFAFDTQEAAAHHQAAEPQTAQQLADWTVLLEDDADADHHFVDEFPSPVTTDDTASFGHEATLRPGQLNELPVAFDEDSTDEAAHASGPQSVQAFCDFWTNEPPSTERVAAAFDEDVTETPLNDDGNGSIFDEEVEPRDSERPTVKSSAGETSTSPDEMEVDDHILDLTAADNAMNLWKQQTDPLAAAEEDVLEDPVEVFARDLGDSGSDISRLSAGGLDDLPEISCMGLESHLQPNMMDEEASIWMELDRSKLGGGRGDEASDETGL